MAYQNPSPSVDHATLCGRAIEILETLISFQTTSDRSNLELIKWVEDLLRPTGARLQRVGREDAPDKTNLIVSTGPDRPAGIVLSGHTDVVPAAGQVWTTDPFSMIARGGRLYGRGTSDMKGFVAVSIAAAEEAARHRLTVPLHLALSYDEEIGCLGVGPMAEIIGTANFSPRLVIVGEPSQMNVVTTHKGGLIGHFVVRGTAGHSSMPDRFVNAVMIAADIVSHINGLSAELRMQGKNLRLDPPYSTIQVNMINGGTHSNIVAERCEFTWEMRTIPGHNCDEILSRIMTYINEVVLPPMKRVNATAGIELNILGRVPSLDVNTDDYAEQFVMRLAEKNDTRAVSYGSEAGFFQRHNVPTVICGPGNIAQAHQPDEYIEISEMEACGRFMARLVETLAIPDVAA